MARVYIDAAYFGAADSLASFPAIVDDFKRLVSRLQTDKVECFAPGGGYLMQTGAELVLASILFEHANEYGLDPSEVTDLSRLLDRCQSCTQEVDTDYTSHGAAAPRTSSAYPHAHAQANDEQVIGVLVAKPYESGPCGIEFKGADRRHTFLLAADDAVPRWYRNHLVVRCCSAVEFERYRGKAFPDITFADGVSPDDLGVHLGSRAGVIVDHLSYLNDAYVNTATRLNWDFPSIQGAARANGVEMSDESSNTKGAPKKMRHRRVPLVIDGNPMTVECTLHTKIDATKGRIHFSVETISNKKVLIVGIMHEHLPI